MKKYPAYKKSGVEYIGEVPEHWEIAKLKFLADSVKTGSTPPSDELHYYEPNEIDWFGPADFKALVLSDSIRKVSGLAITDNKCRLFPASTVLLIGIGATVGKVGVSAVPCSANQQINAVTFNQEKCLPKFGAYYLSSIRDVIVSEASSATLPIFNQTHTKELVLPCPTHDEQVQICSYLDCKTEKIDILINNKEKLIELLKEERTATISQTVAKGLHPNVSMKDSGIQWLGEIPKHWGVVDFKRVSKRNEVGIAEAATHAYVETGGVPILRSTNIKEGKIKGKILQIDKAFAFKNKSKTIFAKDLITVRTGNAGLTAVVGKELDGCQCFTMLITTLQEDHSPEFYSYVLNSKIGSTNFELNAWGTAQKNISVPILKFTKVPVPPSREQVEIVKYLDNELERLDSLILKEKRLIKQLEEYKTALISQVITGKIDVREDVMEFV